MIDFEVNQNNFILDGKVLPFGETLLDFLSVDIRVIQNSYPFGVIPNFNHKDYDEYIEEIVADLRAIHPYFALFNSQFRRWYNISAFTEKDKLSMEEIFHSCLQRNLDYVAETQNTIKKALAYALTTDDKLTPAMRLLVYINVSEEMRDDISPDLEIRCNGEIDEDLETEKEFKDFILKNNLKFSEFLSFNSIQQLCTYELIKLINLDLNIKSCKFCGNFFIPKSRSDTEYCDRIKTGEIKSCMEIGPMRMYQDRTKTSPVYAVYNKAYKRNNSRVRSKMITQSQFLAWSDQAREKRDLALAGKMSFDEFEQWCNSSR